MAQFDKEVNIKVDVDVKPGNLGSAVEQLNDLDNNLDNLVGNLDQLEDKFEGINTDSIEESVDELEDVGTIDPKFGEVDVSDSKGRLKASANRHIRDINTGLEELTPKLAASPDTKQSGLLIPNSNSKIESIEEALTTLDIKISGDVKWGNGGANWAAAQGSYNRKIESFEETADLSKIEPEIAGTINTESLKGLQVPDSVSDDLDEINSLLSSIRDVNEANEEALRKAQELREGKAELREEQEKYERQTSETTVAQDDEAVSFVEAMENAEGLADAKRAATKSNRILNESAEKTEGGITRELEKMDIAGMSAQELGEKLDVLKETQDELGDKSDNTGNALALEEGTARELADGMDGLAGAKQAAANANRKLGEDGDRTVGVLQDEFDISEENARSILNMSESMNDATDNSRSLRRSVRRMNEATDSSTDSMRAAAEVGDLFEDGLGSLSVNLGAFTIALRNFLTQIPLLLTALGAVGAAAFGAAAGFAALAGALGGVVAAGALVHAQNLKNEYGEIEELGQAMQVIMRNLFDILLEAIEPLTSMKNITNFFTVAVEGLATGISMLSNAIAFLVSGSEEFVDSASGISDEMFTIQDAIDSFDGRSWENLTASIMEAWILLGEEVTWALGTINNALANAISRSSQLLSEVNNVSSAFGQFSSTLSELAELGFTIGSGLLPIFEAFSSIVETMAGAINEMDDQMVANLVTFGAMFAAINKVSGTAASLVRVIPSIVTGFSSISAAAASAETAMGGMRVAMSGVLTNVGEFMDSIGAFGGMSELAMAAGSTGESFRDIAFASDEATAKFRALALNSEMSAEAFQNLAAKGELGEETIEAFASQSEELGDVLDGRVADSMADLDFEIPEDMDAGEFMRDFEFDADDNIDASEFSGVDESLTKTNSTLRDTVKNMLGMGDAADESVDAAGAVSGVTDRMAAANQRLANSNSAVARATARMNTAVKNSLMWMNSAIGTVMVSIGARLGLTSAKAADTTATQALIMATKGLASSMNAVIGKLLYAIGGFKWMAFAEGSATTATVLLNAAFTSLTGGLNKIIPAIIGLIVILGALTVGVLKNMDGIKSAFQGMFAVVKTVVGAIVDILMVTFMSVWDALRMTIEPLLRPIKTIMMAFQGTGDAAEGAGGSLSILATAFDALLSGISFIIRAIGVLGKVLTTVLIIPLELVAIVMGIVIDLFQWFSSVVADAIKAWGPFKQLFSDTADDANGLIDIIAILFDSVVGALQGVGGWLEDFINNAISMLNGFIKGLNKVPGINIAEVSKIDITRDEATGTSQPEVDPKKDNTITYNEDNSTNIDQTVNADPEDQAQLSRVVTDAIAEANSFERRRQGGQ